MTEFKSKSQSYYDPAKLVSRSQAVKDVKKAWTPMPEIEKVPVQESIGRYVAKDLFSSLQIPVCRESMCDGIAVRSSDFANGWPDTSNWKEGADYCAADTGDDFSDAFDTVIQIEKVSFEGGKVRLQTSSDLPQAGMKVRQAGSVLKNGELLVRAKTRLDPMKMSLLATGGFYEVPCIRKPKFCYLPTGSELVPIGEKVHRGEHTETNGLLIENLLESWGAHCCVKPIIQDNKKELAHLLEEALAEADGVIINGGSSMGSEDFNSSLIREHSSYFQHGVKCMPGMPIALAVRDGKPIINLPGPPFAAYFGAQWCVRELVAHWYGLPFANRTFIKARLSKAIHKPFGFEAYIKLHLMKLPTGVFWAEPLSMGSVFSAVLANFDAFAVISEEVECIEAGQFVNVQVAF